ncbi:MAG: polyisoprenoid-binding protein [Fibrobacteria bacterium]|nr:polyisoprenoid-binding protein [Fibrobacteria bacterium]
MKSLILSIGLFLATATTAQTWNFDASHSSVDFSARHLLVSNTRGNFDSMQITLSGDPKNLSSLEAKATIQVASINTRNSKRDEHLRAEDFFDAAKFPQIEFVSTKVVGKNGKGTMTGDLTMHGVKRTVSIPFTVSGPIEDPWKNTRLGLEGTLKIQRKDFGIGASIPDGVVGPEIVVDIVFEGIQQK